VFVSQNTLAPAGRVSQAVLHLCADTLQYISMDIIIGCKNFELTPSLRTYIEEKVGKLANYWDRIIRARVELEVDKNKRGGLIHSATVTLEVPGPDIRVQEEAGDMHAAIDLTMPVLERQIKKAKNKLEHTDWRHMDKAKEKFRQWYERMRGNNK